MAELTESIYAGGAWHRSGTRERISVVNPANDRVIAEVTAGCAADVDRAVTAARAAFPKWSRLEASERLRLLQRLQAGIQERAEGLATTITSEMGAPVSFSRAAQIGLALRGIQSTIAAMSSIADERIGGTLIVREAVGVVAAITPWNFPLHQIIAKIAPALAAGCVVVLKASEVTPLDAIQLAGIIDDAGFPAGVFNLVTGGRETGEALVSHPGVDMVTFTGSTRGGRRVATVAAEGLKKVALELGGKSANILLDDADLARAVPGAVQQCFVNSGQVCAALSRLFVPESRLAEVESLAVAAAKNWTLGDPADVATRLGPLASRAQQAHVRKCIELGISEGARLLVGGPEQPKGFDAGAYVLPTIFSGARNDMALAREEIFGPVLAIVGYADEDEAIRMANDSDYGLSGGVWSASVPRAVSVARRLSTGQVVVNGASLDLAAPFGGVKRSGYGRENGKYGLEEFFNVKAVLGAGE
ncbi:aldehyde dehydrogenase family protein [Steroidobacter flavus]|uniref:aldehyde dehydrogenase (NAD(+)) n=1 Tax=Steroidobacter flavus TaxID=1842136 RepID=A0ABV8T7F0_9GAMM